MQINDTYFDENENIIYNAQKTEFCKLYSLNNIFQQN